MPPRASPPRTASAGAGPAREAAHRILLRVSQEDAWASRLLEALEAGRFDPRDVALAHEIVLGVLRWRGRLDHELRTVCNRPIEELDPPVREALRIGAYQLLLLDRIPAHAAVNGSVELVRRTGGRGAAGLVNAVLRRLAAEGKRISYPEPAVAASPAHLSPSAPPTLSSSPLGRLSLAAELSHPEWMIERALRRWPETVARDWLLGNNLHAPICLRPNPLHEASPRLTAALAEVGVLTEPGLLAPEALRVLGGRPAHAELFREGAYWIQDEASQIVPLLFPPPWVGLSGDLCAAPGGKTFVLATGPPGRGSAGGAAHRIVAFDLHHHRLARVLEGARRIAPDRIAVAVSDLAGAPAARDGVFDRVLVDAPCSGTGVLRRHPEIRWRLHPERLAELASLQSRLLEGGLRLLRPGGYLVYSVCSIEPEETDEVLDRFLERSGCRSIDPRSHLDRSVAAAVGADGRLRTFPYRRGSDGFFAALVQKPGSIG